jgi:hypothetical protein
VIPFATYDAGCLYKLNAVHDPTFDPSFPSDEVLLGFERHLQKVIPRQQLPEPQRQQQLCADGFCIVGVERCIL